MIILVILCAIACSVLYRAGGLSKEQPYWIPVWMRRSWVRDWLCPLFVLLPLFIQQPHWIFIPIYGIMGALLTTYWDWLFKYDNFWFSGFFVGLSIMPLILIGCVWWIILIKAIILAVLWGGWCTIFKNDHMEEHGRGLFLGVLSV